MNPTKNRFKPSQTNFFVKLKSLYRRSFVDQNMVNFYEFYFAPFLGSVYTVVFIAIGAATERKRTMAQKNYAQRSGRRG